MHWICSEKMWSGSGLWWISGINESIKFWEMIPRMPGLRKQNFIRMALGHASMDFHDVSTNDQRNHAGSKVSDARAKYWAPRAESNTSESIPFIHSFSNEFQRNSCNNIFGICNIFIFNIFLWESQAFENCWQPCTFADFFCFFVFGGQRSVAFN